MTKKELAEIKKEFKKLESLSNHDKAEVIAEIYIEELWKKKLYPEIVTFAYKHLKDTYYNAYTSFEVAYSFIEVDRVQYRPEAKSIYESLLKKDFSDTSVLNNLSNIYKELEEYDKAFALIDTAFKLDKNDEVIRNNFNQLTNIIEEQRAKEKLFSDAKLHLAKENKWAFNKLLNFAQNIKKEVTIEGGFAISSKKFGWLIGTDEEKAQSLREQWLERGYIRDTGKRADYGVHIYEVHPYLEKILQENKPIELPDNWIENIEKLNIEELESLKFFEIISKIKRINRNYREIILRDFQELVFNYIFNNEKAVTVLSGSIIETIFMYYCEKSKITKITYTLNSKTISLDLKDANLANYLEFFNQNKKLSAIAKAIGNVARIYRNMVHPANEIKKSKTPLSKSKLEICYNSVIEVIAEVL
ncbi:MAG: tetratricopeptide repeat protein [Candidatus Dojkabacteria bacterium]